ncbi:MAG: hypothetical protein K9L85_00140 [Candidatus Peribacteraceae bacterium]|nr:hypothetical protein [Candidatus Peribacteraceae bacterium]
MNFQNLAVIVGKKQKTVEVFFSRKQLSIKRDADIREYLTKVFTQKRWRTSDYSAPHLRPYHFRKMDETVAASVARKFSPVSFWDRNPEALTKHEFIQRVVRYGVFEDLAKLKKYFTPGEIRSVYPDQFAMIQDFNHPISTDVR